MADAPSLQCSLATCKLLVGKAASDYTIPLSQALRVYDVDLSTGEERERATLPRLKKGAGSIYSQLFGPGYKHHTIKYCPTHNTIFHHVDRDDIFFVGDIHGDVGVFVMLLIQIGCITLAGGVDDEKRLHEIYQYCPDPSIRERETVYAQLTKLLLWNPHFVGTVVFMGDMVDNRRSADQDPAGVCAYADSQLAIIQTIVRLREHAKHQLVVVVGNHDVYSIIHGMYFAPYMSNEQADLSRKRVRPAWSATFRRLLAEAEACAIFQPVDWLVACHGGLRSDFGMMIAKTAAAAKIVERCNARFAPLWTTPYEVSASATPPVQYSRALQDFWITQHINVFWCRPLSQHSPEACKRADLLPAVVHVVAHQTKQCIQLNSEQFCDAQVSTQLDPQKTPVIFTDLAMSRAFHSPDVRTTARLGYAVINKRTRMFKAEYVDSATHLALLYPK